ncbi:hypothetical protein ACOSQ3_025317 [Xanthoceras sorbifolium]
MEKNLKWVKNLPTEKTFHDYQYSHHQHSTQNSDYILLFVAWISEPLSIPLIALLRTITINIHPSPVLSPPPTVSTLSLISSFLLITFPLFIHMHPHFWYLS